MVKHLRGRIASWKHHDATMAGAGPGLTAGSFSIPPTYRSGVPARIAGVAGIAGRAHEWGRIIVTAAPEGID